MLLTLITAAMLGVPAAQETDTVFAVRPDARLDLQAMNGEVVVRTWDRDEMRVVAEHSERDRVVISVSGAVVRIRAESWRGVPRSVDFEITLPATMGVEINGTFLEVELFGVGGEVRVETVQGDLTLEGGRDFVRLHSVHGDVECVGARGRIDLGSVNGDVDVSDAVGAVHVETVNGDVRLEGIESDEVEVSTLNGDLVYDGTILNGGRYTFSTHSGDVTLQLPEDANATIAVSTFRGEFEAEFPVTLTHTESGGKRFRFTLGTGSAQIEVDSFSGTVWLRRW